MEHFAIVQALSRAAMAQPSDAVRRQIERLRDALAGEGAAKEAGVLSALLTNAQKATEMTPSRLTRSRARTAVVGEELTPKTQLPVDRETAVSLAQAIFPEEMPDQAPMFDEVVTSAVASLLDEWHNIEALQEIDVTPATTCLIYGAPGTGKTHLALWIAKQLQLPVVLARLDGLVSSFLGTTSRNIGTLFAFAGRYRCILLLDEFDAIAKVRDDPQEVGEIKRVVNTLLQNLDARKAQGLTIGITNHEALLDAAVWRRFEVQLAVPRPGFETRLGIAKHYLPPLDLPEPETRLVAWLSEGTTGAEIETLIRSVKKSWVLSEQREASLLPTLRRFATLNSGRLDPERRKVLFLEPVEAARALLGHKELGFDQTALAAVFRRDKGTISRWLSKAQSKRPEVSEVTQRA